MAREEPSALALKLIEEIGKFCQIFGIGESRFGRIVVGDPNLVYDLRRGRSLTLRTVAKVQNFIDRYRSAKELPMTPVRYRPGSEEVVS